MLQVRLSPISFSEIGSLVLSVPAGGIQVIVGLDAADLGLALDARENDRKLCLFIGNERSCQPDAFVSQIVDALALAALANWPYWYGTDFSGYRTSTVEVAAAGLRLDTIARTEGRISARWAKTAITLVHQGYSPRVPDCATEIEIAQLSIAIAPYGLVIAINADAKTEEEATAFVQAVEWVARKSNAAVVVLCPDMTGLPSAFIRLSYGARVIYDRIPGSNGPPTTEDRPAIWLVPVIGRPHPLSDIERRLAAAIARDEELAPLFAFNQIVRTVLGSCPRVDLVWSDGRVVVELDGYADHGRRAAFAEDRHRDYELLLSGYAVLRIANDEAAVDIARAVEKIRDVVRLRRSQRRGGNE